MINQYALTWERNEYGRCIRTAYEHHNIKEQRKNMRQPKIRERGICGTISTVLHDNHILEVTYEQR